MRLLIVQPRPGPQAAGDRVALPDRFAQGFANRPRELVELDRDRSAQLVVAEADDGI